MKKGIAQFTAFCMAAGLTFGQGGTFTMAAGTDTALVGIGADTRKTAATVELEKAAEGETAAEEATEAAAVNTEEAAAAETAADTEAETAAQTEAQTETEAETQAPVDKSMIGSTGFAAVDDYLTVRATADAEGEVVGKVYTNDAVDIIDVDDNGWYLVRSGNVEGYVAGYFVATGEAAQDIASQTGYTYAEVGAEVLNVRRDATEDSDVVDTITSSDNVEVVEDNGDWVKVVTDDGIYGYVSADFVATKTAYSTGETVEEEQARLDAEWTAYLAEQEAAWAAEQAAAAEAAASYDYSADTSYTDNSYTDNSYSYSEEQAYADQAAADAQAQADAAAQAQAEADAAQQAYYDAQYVADTTDVNSLYAAYVDAQNAADAAVANGADEATIISTATYAQDAYAAYVTAQNAADAAAQAAADAQAQADAAAQAQAEADAAAQAAAEAQQQAEAQAQETYVEETSNDTYTETYEETYVEETEAPVQETSSVGQQIANFATQFVGNPYVYGGTSLTNGADCSGFVQSVYANFGISLPRTAASQSGVGTAVDMSNLQPGDLLFYSNGGGIGHVTMYIGGGQVVHASSSTTGIIISSIDYRTPVSARRLV